MVLYAARVDGGDRCPVTVAKQNAAAQPDGVEYAGQHVARLLVHEGYTPRQHRRAGAAVAGARVGEHAETGRVRKALWKLAPEPDRPKAFMQQHEGRGFIRTRPDHFVFEPAWSDF